MYHESPQNITNLFPNFSMEKWKFPGGSTEQNVLFGENQQVPSSCLSRYSALSHFPEGPAQLGLLGIQNPHASRMCGTQRAATVKLWGRKLTKAKNLRNPCRTLLPSEERLNLPIQGGSQPPQNSSSVR